jgi:hypothetical protein
MVFPLHSKCHSKLRNILRAVFLVGVLIFNTPLSVAHVHGQGQLRIAQADNEWLFEFVLPAGDVIGFEHQAGTTEEKSMVIEFQKRTEDIGALIHLSARCTVTDFHNSLNEMNINSAAQIPSDKAENEHKDIELRYQVTCKDEMRIMDINLFNWATKISTLEARWITQKGQGSTILNARASTLRF